MKDVAWMDPGCSTQTSTRYYMVPHKMSASKRLFGSGVSVWFRNALRKKTKRSWRTAMRRYDRWMALDRLKDEQAEGEGNGE